MVISLSQSIVFEPVDTVPLCQWSMASATPDLQLTPFPAYAGTHCAYPWRDGQAKLQG